MTIKRKLLPLLIIVLVLSLTVLGLSACKDDQDDYELKIDKNYVELTVGYKASLSADIIGNAEGLRVVWSSSDKQVATVDSVTGIVEAVSEGIATITATAGDKSAACVVVVKAPPLSVIEVTDVTVSQTALTLAVGEQRTLAATVSPSDATDKSVVWDSLDYSIATVSVQGTITAISNGVTVITATAGNKVAMCQVTVTNVQHIDDSLRFNTLQTDGNNVSGVVGSAVDTFNFADEVVAGKDVTYNVYLDVECQQIVPSKAVSLTTGDNKFYILTTCNQIDKLYQITIRKLALCTVTFDTDGGTAVSPITADEGTKILPNSTTKVGYVFNGWNDGTDEKLYKNEYYTVLRNVVLTAKYHPYKCFALFDSNGGSTCNKVEVVYDSDYKLPVPTRQGYLFDGWYINDTPYADENGESLSVWKFTENVTFVAHWRVVYKLKVEAVGCDDVWIYGYNQGYLESGAVTNRMVKFGLGYDFLGWYVDDELLSNEANFQFTMPAHDVTLIVKFKVRDEAANLTFESDLKKFVITGVKDKSVTDITVPEYTTAIEDDAFNFSGANASITSVYWYADKLQFKEGTSIFCDTAIRDFYLGNNVTSLSAWTFFGCDGIENLHYLGAMNEWCNIAFGDETANPLFDSVNWYVNGELVTEIVVPSGVTVIKDFAFVGAKVTSVTLNEGLTEIGDAAFKDCRALTSISFPSTLTSIGARAFMFDSKLEGLVAIPNGVSRLPVAVFYGTKISAVVLPLSIRNIDNNAFGALDSRYIYLNDVYYCGTFTQWWQLVTFAPNNSEILNAAKYYYSEEYPQGNGHYWHYLNGQPAIWDLTRPTVTVVKLIDGEEVGSKTTDYNVGEQVTLTADSRLGYDFLGWYDGDELLSTEANYQFAMPEQSVTYTAKYALDSEVAKSNIDFESTADTFVIKGFKQTGSQDYVYVPEYTTDIEYCAFADMHLTTVLWRANNLSDDIDGVFTWCQIKDFVIDAEVKHFPQIFGNIDGILNLRYQGTMSDWCKIRYNSDDYVNTEYFVPLRRAINWYVQDELVTEIVIPEDITVLNDYAFSGARQVTKVTLHEGITELGEAAFSNCTKLASCNLPQSLTRIGHWAFAYTALEGQVIIPNGVTTLEGATFDKTKVSSLVIPTSVTSIGVYEFRDTPLETIFYLGTAEQWGEIACDYSRNPEMSNATVYFYSESEPALNGDETDYDGNYWHYVDGKLDVWSLSRSMVTVTNLFDENTTSSKTAVYEIGEQVTFTADSRWGYDFLGWYDGDELLSADSSYSFEIPENNLVLTVKYVVDPRVANLMFASTESTFEIKGVRDSLITEITIPEYTTKISQRAFEICSETLTVNWLATNVVSGFNAFRKCSIDTLTLSADVASLPSSVFGGCSINKTYYEGELEDWCKIRIVGSDANPLSVTSEFYVNGSKLTDELVIPASVVDICSFAFSDAKMFNKVTIQNGVKSIGEGAFGGITTPIEITIADSVDSIGIWAFAYSSLTSIRLPQGLKEISKGMFYNCKQLAFIDMPQGLQRIGESAFGFSGLSGELIIPESVMQIDSRAFEQTQITSVTFGKNIVTMGFYAFMCCDQLVNITIQDGIQTISNNTFFRCVKLESVEIPDSVETIAPAAFVMCSSLTQVVLGNGVKTIGNSAFRGTSVQSIVIPASVQTIGTLVFGNNMGNIYYCGTSEQWDLIEITQTSQGTINGTVYFYSESEPALNGDETDYDGNYWHYVNGQPVAWTKEDNE